MAATGKNSDLIRRLGPYALGYAASGGSLMLAAGAQLVTFALLARDLGPDEFGQIVAIMAVIAIAAPFCGLGALEGILRRTAHSRETYPHMLGHALALIVLSGGALAAAGTALLPFIFPLSPDAATSTLAIAAMLFAGIVLAGTVNLAEHAFLAHGQNAAANGVVTAFALSRTVTAALACLGFGVTTAAEWSIWFLACHLLCAAAALWSIRRLGSPRFGVARDELKLGLWFSLPILARAMRQNVDLIVLGLVAGGETLASYGIARRILDASYLSVGALNRLVYTGSAAAAARGPSALLERARTLAFAGLAVSALAAAAIWLLAPLLPAIFGADYVSLPGFARLTCWLVVAAAVGSIALDAMAAAGRHARRAAILGLGSLAGAALVAAACIVAGPDGAILAAYAADLAVACVAWSVLYRLMRPVSAAARPVPV